MASKLIVTEFPFPVFSTEADTDYLLARIMASFGGVFCGRAGFFAQQACEKYMKAITVQRDQNYLETHKLLELASRCESQSSYFADEETKRILEQFDVFDQVGRYGPTANYDPLSKGQAMGGKRIGASPGMQLAGAWTWQGHYLHDLDAFVFNSRRHFNFAKARYGDGIQLLLDGGARSPMAMMWRGPMPLRDVLTRDNRYFKA